MPSWSGEEVARGLEKWLRVRRDEYCRDEHWDTIDSLLDEVRDNSAEGWLPWQRLNDELNSG